MQLPLPTSKTKNTQAVYQIALEADDLEESMAQADPKKDFALALSIFPLEKLTGLARALAQGKVVSRFYKLGDQRCPFGWLAGWTSRDECMQADYPTPEAFFAVRRSIRFFDQGKLTEADVARILHDAIRDREASQPREKPKSRDSRRALVGV